MGQGPLDHGTSPQRKFPWGPLVLVDLCVAGACFGLHLLHAALLQHFREHGSP